MEIWSLNQSADRVMLPPKPVGENACLFLASGGFLEILPLSWLAHPAIQFLPPLLHGFPHMCRFCAASPLPRRTPVILAEGALFLQYDLILIELITCGQ